MVLGSLASIAAAPSPVAVPIELEGRLCLVPVRLGKHTARMVLDTGAERTVVTRSAAARLGLRRDLWVDTPMVGAGGLVETHPNVVAGSASLGGVDLYQNERGVPVSIAVTDQPLGGADGLLGADMLCHYTLDLDVPNARLMLQSAGAAMPEGIPLQPWTRHLLLSPLRLDGQALMGLVDTGSAASLINAHGLYKLGISPKHAAQGAGIRTNGLGGSFHTYMHRFSSLQLGRLTWPNPLLLTAAVPEAAFDMIVGLDILGQARFRLSWTALILGFG